MKTIMAGRAGGRFLGFGVSLLSGLPVFLLPLLGCVWLSPALAITGGSWISIINGVFAVPSGTQATAMAAGQRLQVVIGLKLPNAAAVAEHVARMQQPADVLYGSRMTPSQFAAQYSPSPAQAQAVATYLTSHGFDNVAIDAGNRLLISADAPVAVIESAFNTRLQRFIMNGRSVFANVSGVQVPSALQGMVLSVLGLQNIAQAHTGAVVAAAGSGAQQSLPPPAFATAYDAAGISTAANTTVAIFMSGDLSLVSSDFQLANSQNHLPQVPVSIIQVGKASSDTSSTLEWDLDSQSSLGIAGNFKRMIWYNAASLGNADLVQALNRWVTDDTAPMANASFGECESDAKNSGFLAMTDQVLMQAAAQGQTLFVASGDAGSVCPIVTVPVLGLPVGLPAVDYPASSPYAVAVGGTTLSTDSAYDYGSESVWSGSGGGISADEPSPLWQQPVLPASSNSSMKKGVPDITMDADPSTGAKLIVNGQPSQIGGTSLSSPLAMGAWARIESAHNNQLGFAAPILYAQASGPGQPAAGFHDIVQGKIGPYSAAPGWDYASGLGSFDVATLSPLIGSAPTQTSTGTPGSNPPAGGGSDVNSTSSGGGGGGTADPAGFMLMGLAALAFRRRKQSDRG